MIEWIKVENALYVTLPISRTVRSLVMIIFTVDSCHVFPHLGSPSFPIPFDL